jgi:hypothetical protein
VAQILHLHDAHGQAQRLLPWAVNGTLSPEEQALVDAHCEECEECRGDLANERLVREAVAGMDVPLEQGWERLSAKLAQEPVAAVPPPARFFQRRIGMGWAIAPTALVAASAALAFFLMPQPQAETGYHLLASPARAAAGNVIVLFAPQTTASDLHSSLAKVGAHIVDGPTESGAYVVSVPATARGKVLDELRANSQVTLAEPIDSESPR